MSRQSHTDDLHLDHSKAPVLIVDLDLDFCDHTCGTSPCTATFDVGGQCYNTHASCLDLPNYQAGTKRYRFSMADGPALPGVNHLPCIRSIKLIPSKIDQRRGLGARDKVTIECVDFRDPWDAFSIPPDQPIDPYRRERASGQGFFFRKLLRRNRAYQKRTIYVRQGYLNRDGTVTVGNFQSRRYVVDTITQDRGVVRIVAKDILALTDQRVPTASRGKLPSGGITDSATSFTLDDYGDDYGAAPFWVRIDDEIMKVGARTGNAFSSITRAQAGTTAAAHNADAQVQICYVQESTRIDSIWSDLLQEAGVDSALIDTTGADSEADTWLDGHLYTAYISKPTAVSTLLADLLKCGQAYTYWDAENQFVRFKVIAPRALDEDVTELSDTENIAGERVSVSPMDSERITRCAIYYGVKDWSANFRDRDEVQTAYAQGTVYIDTEAESADEYGDERLLEIFAYWVPTSLSVEMDSTAYRLVQRFRNPPKAIRFTLEAAEAKDLLAGNEVDVTVDELVDLDGAREQAQALVTVRDPGKDGGIAYSYEVVTTGFGDKIGFYHENTETSDYDSSNTTQRKRGYYANSSSVIPTTGADPYRYA